jgi:hypothetical protein
VRQAFQVRARPLSRPRWLRESEPGRRQGASGKASSESCGGMREKVSSSRNGPRRQFVLDQFKRATSASISLMGQRSADAKRASARAQMLINASAARTAATHLNKWQTALHRLRPDGAKARHDPSGASGLAGPKRAKRAARARTGSRSGRHAVGGTRNCRVLPQCGVLSPRERLVRLARATSSP